MNHCVPDIAETAAPEYGLRFALNQTHSESHIEFDSSTNRGMLWNVRIAARLEARI